MINWAWYILWYLQKAREYPAIHKKIEELKYEMGLTPIEGEKIQRERLRKLLIFSQKHVGYYKRIFAQVGFDPKTKSLFDKVNQIPILTKDLVRKNLNELVADNVNQTELFENATGGSTGVPLAFFQDLPYQTIATAIDAVVQDWWGIKPYDKTALIWGADREFHELSWKERFYQWRERSRSINAFRMTDRNLVEFCQMLERWRPPYLKGYASALEAMAHCARKNGINHLTFKAIRSTAETLWPHQKKVIEETFNAPVFNFYGSREINNLAAECPEERRLHLISNWRFIEVVDEQGVKVPDGEIGYMVVTDLSNYAMPFIRYRNEDIGKLSTTPCSCGRSSPVIEELIGRSTDLIRTIEGDIIHGEYFTHLFYGRDDIKQFQVHQKKIDHLIVRYVPIGTVPQAFIDQLKEKIQKRMGRGVKIDSEVCQDIPVPLSGKHRFTISDVTINDLDKSQNPTQ